jgi:hypothetical protein
MRQPGLWFSFLLLFVTGATDLAARSSELGRPIFRYFTMREYGLTEQNWVALQDRRGRMLFGNHGCVLQYDGQTWEKVPIPGGEFIRALTEDQEGHIWVAGVNCLGQLSPKGASYTFTSMMSSVPASKRPFGNSWDAVSHGNSTYISTDKALLRIRNSVITSISWPSGTGFSWLLMASPKRVFISARGQPLYEVVDDKLIPTVNENSLGGNRVQQILELGQNRLLLLTRENGIQELDGDSLKPFKTEADSIFQKFPIVSGKLLPNGAVSSFSI